MPPDRTVEILRGALELVPGKVFSRPNRASASGAWIDLELWASTWQLKVAAVTDRAAEMCLAFADQLEPRMSPNPTCAGSCQRTPARPRHIYGTTPWPRPLPTAELSEGL